MAGRTRVKGPCRPVAAGARGLGGVPGIDTRPRVTYLRPDMTTSEAVQTVVKVMAPYIGDTMARSATEAHCEKLGIAGDSVSPGQLDALLGKLGGGLNIFLGREKSAALINEVRQAVTAREAAR